MSARRSLALGFSLLEVMVSIGVLAVGMTATFPIVSYTVQRAANARRESMAQAIAVELVETLRAETRFDALGVAPPGLGDGGGLDLWRREVLPHGTGGLAGVPPAVGGRQIASCVADNPAASDFAADNPVGPFWMTRDGELFAVCYSLTDVGTGPCPPVAPDGFACELRVLVKVMWRSANGSVVARRVAGRLRGS